MIGRLRQTGIVAIEMPVPIPSGVTAEGAVELCRKWMAYLGAGDAVIAEGSARVACDLYSRQYIAWVDNHRGNLETDLIDRAVRVSSVDGRQPLIFVRGGILPWTRLMAEDHGIALFSYVAVDGSLEGGNRLGREYRANGLN